MDWCDKVSAKSEVVYSLCLVLNGKTFIEHFEEGCMFR